MKQVFLATVLVALTSEVAAFHWTDLGQFLPEDFPTTKKERRQRMKDAGWIELSDDHRNFVRDRGHEHALKAISHRDKLGEMMGLPAKTDYYGAATKGHRHLLAAGSDEN